MEKNLSLQRCYILETSGLTNRCVARKQAVKELRVATFHNGSENSEEPTRSTTIGVSKVKIDDEGGKVSCPMKSGGVINIKYRVSKVESIRHNM